MSEPHNCGNDMCRHKVTLEEWAAGHPDEAWELLAEVSPHSRVAERLRDALSATGSHWTARDPRETDERTP